MNSPTRQIRLAGTLDMIRCSTGAFALRLNNGDEVQCVLDRADLIESLAKHLNKRVVVVGKAVYQHSGSLLCIEVQHVEEDTGASTLFSRMPPPFVPQVFAQPNSHSDEGRGGVSAFFGIWPGDETDAELMAALKKLRG